MTNGGNVDVVYWRTVTPVSRVCDGCSGKQGEPAFHYNPYIGHLCRHCAYAWQTAAAQVQTAGSASIPHWCFVTLEHATNLAMISILAEYMEVLASSYYVPTRSQTRRVIRG